MKKQIFLSLFIILFVGLATTIIILYAKGYRLNPKKHILSGTGLLAVNSTPQGAAVFIGKNLTTATNNTVNLAPGEYDITISQDGYLPWEKKIMIKQEVVSRIDARLFPKAPTLQSITDSGVANPVIDPTFTKIAFVATPAASTFQKKNGIFIIDMSNRQLLPLQSSLTQIVDDASGDIFSTAHLAWSPDGKKILATTSANQQLSTTYLLDATNFNQNPQDVTETPTIVTTLWQKEKSEIHTAQMNSLKPVTLKQFVTNTFSIIGWSLDETKILYQASTSATMPLFINPPRIGSDTTLQERILQKDAVYVYDTKDDQNFKILDADTMMHEMVNGQPPIQWLPDNMHLIHTHDKRIDIMDYDGINKTTVYAGPFIGNYVFPWSDSSKIVILTNLNNDQILPNLYTISLK